MARFKKRSSSFIDDDGDSDVAQTSKATKKAKTVSSSQGEGKDAEGNPYWEVRHSGLCEVPASVLTCFPSSLARDALVSQSSSQTF